MADEADRNIRRDWENPQGGWSNEQTPAETPFSKRCTMMHCERLYHYLGSIELRLMVLEKAQVYLINQIEGAATDDSIVAAERAHLQKSSKNLLDRWIEACRESCEDVRPSQSIVVNVEPPVARSNSTTFPTFSKFKPVIIVIGVVVAGIITGVLWVVDLLKSLK